MEKRNMHCTHRIHATRQGKPRDPAGRAVHRIEQRMIHRTLHSERRWAHEWITRMTSGTSTRDRTWSRRGFLFFLHGDKERASDHLINALEKQMTDKSRRSAAVYGAARVFVHNGCQPVPWSRACIECGNRSDSIPALDAVSTAYSHHEHGCPLKMVQEKRELDAILGVR